MLKTTETLLTELAANNETRWARFYRDYAPWIEKVLRKKGLAGSDAEDVLQETLVELVRIMPTYRYDPDRKGAFHSLIFKIAQNKAFDLFRKRTREDARLAGLSENLMSDGVWSDESAFEVSEAEWQRATLEMALRRVFTDPTVRESSKIVFRRVVQLGEDVATVARDLGLEPNAIYQIKNRMKSRLKTEVRKILESSPDGH